MNSTPARLFLGLESLRAVNSGIARVAWLVVRFVAEEMQEGRLRVGGIVLRDAAPPQNLSFPVIAAGTSRLWYLLAVNRAHFTYTHFLYDFLGVARAHGWLPFLRRPSLCILNGIETWPGPWGRADRIHTARRTTLLVANSTHTRDRACKLDAGFARAKVCWLATLEETPPPPPPRDRPACVLILARMDEMAYKGHRELIECWSEVVAAVPEARLLIAGGGPKIDDYRRLAASTPVAAQVEFTGVTPDDQIEAVWNRATVFAMPSRGEGFGLVYIEAMRHGLPIIASVHDAGPEINLDGQTGYNVNLDRPGELPERLIHLLKNADHAAALGANGQRRWLEHFRYSAFRERFRPLLREFLEY